MSRWDVTPSGLFFVRMRANLSRPIARDFSRLVPFWEQKQNSFLILQVRVFKLVVTQFSISSRRRRSELGIEEKT